MAAAILIPLFVGLIAVLMFVGWRSRPELEIPPRTWPIEELPPAVHRIRSRLRLIGFSAFGLGYVAFAILYATGSRRAGRALLIVGVSVYLATWLAQLVVVLRGVAATKRKRTR